MFNLLVSGNSGAWEDDRGSMVIGRFKEYSGDEADTIALGQSESLSQLERIPSLLMYEHGVEGLDARIVRYGALRNIRVEGREIVFDFVPDAQSPYFSRSDIQAYAAELGLHRFENTRTHWAIKDGNLPTALLQRGVAEKPELNLEELAREYVEALKRRGRAQVESEELLGLAPSSIEKAVALYKAMSEEKPVIEMCSHLGIEPKTAAAREFIRQAIVQDSD